MQALVLGRQTKQNQITALAGTKRAEAADTLRRSQRQKLPNGTCYGRCCHYLNSINVSLAVCSGLPALSSKFHFFELNRNKAKSILKVICAVV